MNPSDCIYIPDDIDGDVTVNFVKNGVDIQYIYAYEAGKLKNIQCGSPSAEKLTEKIRNRLDKRLSGC